MEHSLTTNVLSILEEIDKKYVKLKELEKKRMKATFDTNRKFSNKEEIKYYSNLGKVIKSSNFKIKINMIKNSIPLVKVISYDENKFCSKNEILSQL